MTIPAEPDIIIFQSGLMVGRQLGQIEYSIVNDPTHFNPEISMTNVAPINPPTETVAHTWDNDTQEAIADHAATCTTIKKQRKALNDEMAASKSSLVAIGMNAEALAAAQAFNNLSEDDLANFDQTYIFARRALGKPIQEDLFMAAMQKTVTVETPAGKED